MTFSEFGRRIISNGAAGTDHGAAGPVMVFGKNVVSGIIGNNPQIPEKADDRDNTDMQYDYRNVYAAVLEDWLGAKKEVSNDVLKSDFVPLPIFKAKDPLSALDSDLIFQNYPNPVTSVTTIRFFSLGGHTQITLRNSVGLLVRTLVNDSYDPGAYQVVFTRDNLSPGSYYYTIFTGGRSQTMTMVIAG